MFDHDSGRCLDCDGHYKHSADCPSAEPCTIPCDGTGWTGNPRERCTTHYSL